jgi:uncharacterized repeat protein (TIGR01451 family)
MYRLTHGFGMIAVLMFLLSSSSRAVEFASPVAYAVGPQPAGVITGDFNGDGKLDLAVFNTGSNTVSILLGNGDGTFQTAKSVPAGVNPSSLALGDFNGDGKLDIAVFVAANAYNAVSGQIVILLGNGDGTFEAPVVTTLTVTTQPVAIGDFNGDKKADVIVGNADCCPLNMTLQILLGNGDGTFQKAQPISPTGTLTTTSVAVADFNKDGKLDLAVGVAAGVEILTGQGDGTFVGLGSTVPVAAGQIYILRVADVNGDGYPDLIVDTREALGGMPKSEQYLGVLLNNGSGGFHSEQVFVSNLSTLYNDNSYSTIVFGDFNGDGKLDVGLGPASSYNYPSVLLGKGDGTFALPVILDEPTPLGVAGNFNGDKLTDLTVLDAANGNVNILLNDSPASGTDLAILTSGASPEPVGVGTVLTYTADVMNEGPQDATGVIFTDALPSSVSFVSATASQGTCSQASSVVTCSIGSLSDTSDVQITIAVTPNTVGSITNNMSIAGNETDGATANNTASQNSTLVPVYTLTVTQSGSGIGTVTIGGNGSLNCTSPCSVPSGALMDVHASPDFGSILQNWGGACAGTSSSLDDCILTITSNMSASVTFGFVGPAPGFTITAASSSVSTSAGATVSDMITVTPQGFTGVVNLTCSITGPAPLPTCGLSPTSIANGGISTLTIAVPSRNAILPSPVIPSLRALPFEVLSLLAVFAMLLLTMSRNSEVPTRRDGWILGATMAASILILSSCGGSSSPPPPQNYSVNVTGSWAPVANSTKTIQIQLTVR